MGTGDTVTHVGETGLPFVTEEDHSEISRNFIKILAEPPVEFS